MGTDVSTVVDYSEAPHPPRPHSGQCFRLYWAQTVGRFLEDLILDTNRATNIDRFQVCFDFDFFFGPFFLLSSPPLVVSWTFMEVLFPPE